VQTAALVLRPGSRSRMRRSARTRASSVVVPAKTETR